MGIWIKYGSVDDGTRPLSSGRAWWTNENITLINSQGEPVTELVAKEPVTVRVIFRSKGEMELTNVRFKAWIKPTNFLVKNAEKAKEIEFGDKAHLVEGSIDGNLPANETIGIPGTSVSWTPQEADISENPFVAVAVHAWADQDGGRYDELDLINDAGDGLNSIRVIVLSKLDHIRDFVVVEWPPKRDPGPLSEHTFLDVIRLPAYAALDRGTSAAIGANSNVRSVRLNLADPKSGPQLQRGLALAGRTLESRSLRSGLVLAPDTDILIPLQSSRYAPKMFGFAMEDSKPLRRLEIPHTGEGFTASLRLRLNDHNCPGDVYYFDVVQRTESGVVIAGIRLVVIVAP